MINKQGIHVGGRGNWGFCENWNYDTECTIGKSMIELQNYLDHELGIKGLVFVALIAANTTCNYN